MEQSSPMSFARRTRLQIVDAVKGIAIILMVFGHAEQGAMHRHIWESMPNVERGIKFSDAFIYSFHMPVFFFASGLFLVGSVERRGRWRFVLEKAKTLLYPYLLWALLSFVLDPLTLKFRSADRLPSLHERISGILSGNSSWFLITLLETQLLALIMLRLPRWVQMMAAITMSLLVQSFGITILYKPFVVFPFVVAGMWFGSDRVGRIASLPKGIAWASFAALFLAQLAVIGSWGPVNRWGQLPFGLTGIAMLLFLGQAISDGAFDRGLRWYGGASLGIFILSPFFQGAAREFVGRVLHTTNPLTYLTFITLCATTVPALLWFAQDRLHIVFLFRWPANQRAASPSIARRDHATQ